MPWLRSGDNAATHPIVMRVASFVMSIRTRVFERDVAINEVFGFVTRCALQSAGHTTDYVIDEGTVLMIGGARTDRLLELAIKAGYLIKRSKRGVTVYVLVDDPQFLHMRTKAELEAEKQRKADNSNKGLTGPVRLRDGDQCRYCGVIVNWRDRKGQRGGTYDHREGVGKPARFDTLVVACFTCNRSRSNRDDADERLPLLPAPTDPIFGSDTVQFLEERGYRVEVTEGFQRPGTQPDTAPSDPAASRTPRTPTAGRAPVTSAQRPTHGPHAPPGTADHLSPESGLAGTGRDGSASGSSSSLPVSERNIAGTGRSKRSRRGRQHRSPPGRQT